VPISNFLNLFERNIGWLEDGWKSSFTILQRLKVQVSKEPYVKEEVAVKKKPVTETETITDEVRSEKVRVHGASED
jgi:Domain of unknown function (DUF2382)